MVYEIKSCLINCFSHTTDWICFLFCYYPNLLKNLKMPIIVVYGIKPKSWHLYSVQLEIIVMIWKCPV